METLEPRQMLAGDFVTAGLSRVPQAAPTAIPAVVYDFSDAQVIANAGGSRTVGSHAAGSETHRDPEFIQLATPDDLPQQFSVTVAYGGETLTLQLEKHSVFGENTRFLIDDGEGNPVEIDPGPDGSYLGHVEEHPMFRVSAVLTADGLLANVIRPNEPSLTIEPVLDGTATIPMHRISLGEVSESHEDEHGVEVDTATLSGTTTAETTTTNFSRGSSNEPAPFAAPPGSTPGTLQVLEFEIGIEIGSRAFFAASAYNGNLSTAMASAQSVIGNLDARYLHGAGVKHKLGTVRIRDNVATDPLRDSVTGTGTSSSAGSSLSAFRNYWNKNPDDVGNTHDLAVYHVLSAPSGLAYVNSVGTSNRYATTGGNGATSWANGTVVHEFGHSWNLRHTGDSGFFYESKPRNNSGSNSAGGEDVFVSVMHGGGSHNIGRLASDEAEEVYERRQAKQSFGTVVPNPGPISPFGYRDEAIAAGPVTIDVLNNDHDFNNDAIDVQLLDTVSQLGGTIRLSIGTGPSGRNEILYTPASGASGQDFFHYTVVDSTDRTDWAAVYVTIDNPAISVDLSQDFYAYDFGTTSSDVFSNSTVQAVRVSPATTGDVTWSIPVMAEERAQTSGNAYNYDLVWGTNPTTWSHKIENGIWSVTVNMSDPNRNLDNMFVLGEGEIGLSNLDRPIGTNTTVDFTVTVTDGMLDLTFADADGTNPLWALNRIVLQQLEAFVPPLLPGDFHLNEIVDAADFTVWRDTLGQTVPNFTGADADGNGVVEENDYAIWQANFGEQVETTELITATIGNGEFAVDSENGVQTIGSVGAPSISLERDRALVSTSATGRGISIPGWTNTRVNYAGSNAAIGFDGSFGLAPNAGTGVGQTGQAFVNSGAVNLVSDVINHHFSSGDILDLSYRLGSDTAGATASANATVSLIFDEGLPTQMIREFAVRSATGLAAPAITEQYRIFEAANTLKIQFLLDGVETGERTLLDSVFLTAKS